MATRRSFEELLQTIREELKEVIEQEGIERWLSEPNNSFNGRSPIDILREDGEEGYELLHDALEATKLGIYT